VSCSTVHTRSMEERGYATRRLRRLPPGQGVRKVSATMSVACSGVPAVASMVSFGTTLSAGESVALGVMTFASGCLIATVVGGLYHGISAGDPGRVTTMSAGATRSSYLPRSSIALRPVATRFLRSQELRNDPRPRVHDRLCGLCWWCQNHFDSSGLNRAHHAAVLPAALQHSFHSTVGPRLSSSWEGSTGASNRSPEGEGLGQSSAYHRSTVPADAIPCTAVTARTISFGKRLAPPHETWFILVRGEEDPSSACALSSVRHYISVASTMCGPGRRICTADATHQRTPRGRTRRKL
jgi:hypothetical protein